jgi:hypothetical protein
MSTDDPEQPDRDGKLPDAKQWLTEHGFAEVAAQIAEIEAEWARAGKKTRRNWWDVLAGGPNGKPRLVAGRAFPVIEAARRRQGLARAAASPDAPNTIDTARPAAETLAPTAIVASTGASSTTAGGPKRDLAADSERPAPRRAFAAVAQRLGLRFTSPRRDDPGRTLRQLEREPEGSIIARGLNGKFDHVDAFVVGIRDVDQYSIDYLTALVFTSIPWWSRLLFDLRNILVKPLGLAHGRVAVSQDVAPSISFALGEKAIFFTVVDRSDREIVMAEDDKHLQFRVSVLTEERTLCLTTLVQYHSSLGQRYFTLIEPFHKLIVRSMLSRTAQRLA